MAKRKAAKTTGDDVEPMVIALAEQLGSFLGRLQKKADGWRGNAAMRQQASQIRDGAADLLKQVSKAGASAKKSVMKAASDRKPASPKRQRREGESKAKSKAKRANGGAPDAPSRRL